MAGLSKVGKKGLQDGALTTTAASAPTVGAKGELFYNTAENKLYVSNGTAWTRISNDAPSATGGTVVISTLNEGATFSYNLGTNFTDDANTDAELTYSLESGTLPGGATLPTSGNSAMTGTVGNVSSNTVYTFSITARDAAGATATQDYQQQINTVAATVTGGTVTISAVNEGSSTSYDVDSNFTFGTSSTFSAYSLQSGSLPSGLSLNTSTGVISGTMGNVSSTTAYSFTIRGTDTDGDTADQAYSWTITNVPFTATGGTITNISGYRVHTFTSSASGASGFVPNKSGTVQYLVVAGGGSGGAENDSAGGGAGGFRSSVTGESSGGGASAESAVTVSASSYSVTVGGGGAKGYPGANGGNSSFIGTGVSITSIGGGRGGAGGGGSYWANNTYIHGASGGSGGGGDNDGPGSGGAGTTGQGYAGGPGSNDGGGGGGAGVAGTTGPISYGGNGVQSSINGTTTYYAGGGGGGGELLGGADYGRGGLGGGAAGSIANSAGNSATTNSGGGGGGVNANGTGVYGGSGGSGIVIIRYAV